MVIVTGGNGFIGKKVISLSPEKFITIEPKTKLDFRNGFELDKNFIEKYQIKSALLLGGITRFPLIRENSDKAFHVNVNKLLKTINNLSKLDMHMIFISSESVFSGISGKYKEYDKPKPIFLYGYMKYIIEKYLNDNVDKKKFTIIRTTKVYDKNPHNNSLFKDSISYLGKEIPFKIISDIYTNPIEINTLSKVIHKITNDKIPGTFHIGGLDIVSRKDIIVKINSFLKKKKLSNYLIQAEFTSSKNVESFKYLPENTSLDCSFSKKKIGFNQDSILKDIEDYLYKKLIN